MYHRAAGNGGTGDIGRKRPRFFDSPISADEAHRLVETRIDFQDTEGAWWMPWHRQPMKDVVSCDKPRGVANTL